jgi:hypothetical protein
MAVEKLNSVLHAWEAAFPEVPMHVLLLKRSAAPHVVADLAGLVLPETFTS